MKNPNIVPTAISFFLISMGALLTVLSASWLMSYPANYGVSNTAFVVGCVLGPIVMIIGIGMIGFLRSQIKKGVQAKPVHNSSMKNDLPGAVFCCIGALGIFYGIIALFSHSALNILPRVSISGLIPFIFGIILTPVGMIMIFSNTRRNDELGKRDDREIFKWIRNVIIYIVIIIVIFSFLAMMTFPQ